MYGILDLINFKVKFLSQFQSAFLSTGFLALELALFQQFVDDAGSLDGKTQGLMVAQSAKDDSATGPLQHHQFETPVDCTHDVAMYSMPASPHDRLHFLSIQNVASWQSVIVIMLNR